MRLIGVSMVKNEIDIIEYFVRHNLKFLDALLIIDNGSIDGTREMLSKLMSEEKLPIAIFDAPEMGHCQSEKTTELASRTDQFLQSDFILVLDADEFIMTSSRQELESSLSKLPPETAGRVKWKTYVLTIGDQTTNANIFERITHRRAKENPQYHKVVIPKNFSKDSDNIIADGNHYLKNKKHQIPHQIIAEFAIAHFPVRSLKQLKLKILLGWLGYLVKKPKKNEGYHWKQIYDLILNNKLTPDTLNRISYNYSQQTGMLAPFREEDLVKDPLLSNIQITYQNSFERDEVFTIIKSIEKNLLQPTLLPEEKIKKSYIDWPPFKYINEKYKPESVLEIGCNKGEYVKLLEDAGVKYSLGVGTKPYDDSMLCDSSSYFYYDCFDKLNSDKKFDLMIFTEQIQTLKREQLAKVMQFMAECSAGKILFSCATQKNPGIKNVNSINPSYRIEYFSKMGWKVNVFDTLVCRSMASYPWFKSNLTILEKSDTVNNNEFKIQDVINISLLKFPPTHAKPNFYMYPLSLT
ncbi:MAG: glycosyltransferase family 2 protein [Desulfocapsaceae bacterium]|nr:glycosyltransferase family 2 protein [Desulfocapsaceae bacterium]